MNFCNLNDCNVIFCRYRELKLYATMDSDFNACVGYKIDVTIFGHDIKGDGEACLRLGFLDSLVNRVTDDEDTPLETKGYYSNLSSSKKLEVIKCNN